MMKKTFLTIVSAMVIAVSLNAQAIDGAVKDIYYRKFTSAKEVLQKAVDARPTDADAAYWLGQVYIGQENLAAARNVYAKAMTATNQNPLIVVGMGHVELLEGKAADARAHFDAALAATNNKKGGDPKILTAVGRANADGSSKVGDPVYGIDKLNTAAKLDPKNPEIQLLIGQSQLKRGAEFGGAAKTAYDQALAIDPTYAAAKLRTARIFQSQNNPTIFIPLLEESVRLDPNYAPGYLALYDYYSRRDVNKAKTYLDQYMAKANVDCETNFFYADYLLQAGQRDASLAKAKEMEAACSGDNFAKLNKLYALVYFRNNDSVQAKNYMEKYMQKQIPASLTADDYILMAQIYSKFPGTEAQSEQVINRALELDTVVNNQLTLLRGLAATYADQKNYTGRYRTLSRMMAIRPDTTALNFYNYINAAIDAKDYLKADTMSQLYISNYPEQPQGYALRIKATTAFDADTSLGTAIPSMNQYIQFLKSDTAKNKYRIMSFYSYQIFHYANKAKDYPRAMAIADSILALDPGNNYATQVKNALQKASAPRTTTPTRPTTPATKPKTPAATKPRSTK